MEPKNFRRHVYKFMEKYSLLPKGSAFVGVSGGMDSMVLLDILRRKFPVTSLHVNHNLRNDSPADALLVKKYCEEHAITLKIKELSNPPQSNIEAWARQQRKNFFEESAKNNQIYTAHHVDDSFEWWLLQNLRTSNSPLGIPLVNKNLRRPLLCVTREQISRYAMKENIPFREDSSNLNCHFERNYLRNCVIPKIKARHPSYLKHYVTRSLALAGEKNLLYRCYRGLWEQLKHEDIFYHSDNDFRAERARITQSVRRLSTGGRGEISKQITKAIEMLPPAVGPLILSGKVRIYAVRNFRLILSEKGRKLYEVNDLSGNYLGNWENKSFTLKEFEKKLKDKQKRPGLFPFWVRWSSRPKWSLNWKRSHPLWPRCSQSWKDVCTAGDLLNAWRKRPEERIQINF